MNLSGSIWNDSWYLLIEVYYNDRISNSEYLHHQQDRCIEMCVMVAIRDGYYTTFFLSIDLGLAIVMLMCRHISGVDYS